MDKNTILVFTRFGMGDAPEKLQTLLAEKYLALLIDSNLLPAKILFYTYGVKLACQGSPVLAQLRILEQKGVELILCSTCLGFFDLTEKVEVGINGSMADILECMAKADKVISL
jgi:intracellular sulfur oxidation DsrE/DsrF family protein